MAPVTIKTGATPPGFDIDPFSDTFLADPYAYHAELREAGPVVHLASHDVYGMARYGEVSDALRDWAAFCSSRGVGLSDFAREAPWRPPSLLLETDPPVHGRTRRLMNRVVSLSALKALRPAWQARADALVGGLVARRQIDIVPDLAEAFPLAIFPDTIGLPVEGRELLLDHALAAFNGFGPRNHLFEQSHARAAAAIEWVAMACRRENLSADGWGMDVYRAADAGDCSEDEAERLVRSFLSAGVDTTVNGIGNLLHAFALYPDQWRALRADPSLSRRAIEEGLRWDSTVQTFFRTTTRDIAIEGCTIPEGSKVLLFYAAANRDPRKWPDADRFDITRNASGHIAFGYGVHQCLGQMVARQEAEVVLNALIPRVAEIRLAGPIRRRLNNTLHALASLPVELVPA